jgi:hypothetical protein
VGLAASDAEQVPELLRELADHYEHYRRSARSFSRNWLIEHGPDRTLELIARSLPEDNLSCPRCVAGPAESRSLPTSNSASDFLPSLTYPSVCCDR